MPEDTDERIAQVMLGLMRARRALDLDPQTFDDLVGSIMVEIDLGMQVAEEAALEARHRRQAEGSVVAFPPARFRQPEGRGN
ncbi:hypothetical protein MKK58_20020 [Methylobacterium sp. J-078]|jgi:hypothetical protein|uniref:hypothetical protein n=1 Tax=Methylobacterium sp. J-078 TaxID=2836657 RepID=UPI001FBBE2D5|nr:hypothetical protein [Methylobacterium sp. J-078]MCJ2046805.1 hypothetical protein [Methylobacterium sp. J-078]